MGRSLVPLVLLFPVLAHAEEPRQNAGYRNGTFYLRSDDDDFRLYVQARVHADWLRQLGPGVTELPPNEALKGGFALRRARLEIGGEFFERWQWLVGAELGPTSTDNPGATTAARACAVDPSGALACADRESAVESPAVRPAPADVYVNLAATPWTNVQVGQFYMPLSLENRFSDNTTPFLERSLAVRGLGAPFTRDIGAMLWGESPDHALYYAVAILNGDGPNRTNADSRYDFTGRVFARPLANAREDDLRWAQVGASARFGTRDPNLVGYDMPALTTQGGFAFWRPTYRDSHNRLVHVIPAAHQWAIAEDLYLPVGPVDLTGELVYAHSETREAIDGYQLSPFTERAGSFAGYGYYVTVGAWVAGDRSIIGPPSYGRPLHVDLAKPQVPAKQGVQLLARFEQLKVTYRSAERGGVADPATPDGDIEALSVAIGANYWATRHLRVSLNYAVYTFPESAPVSPGAKGRPQQTASQRALAPAQYLAKGVDDAARDTGHTVHEIGARVGVQF